MENIVSQIWDNFDFALMFIINIATYIAIKIIDEANGDKIPTVLQKRIVFAIFAVLVSLLYVLTKTDTVVVAINSAILAPVSWSWIFRPVMNKMGFGYKQEEVQ